MSWYKLYKQTEKEAVLVSLQEAIDIVNNIKSTFFTIGYMKQFPDVTNINCRKGVTKPYTREDNPRTPSRWRETFNTGTITIYCKNKDGEWDYRKITPEKIVYVATENKIYVVETTVWQEANYPNL